jgi:hypothetical protein
MRIRIGMTLILASVSAAGTAARAESPSNAKDPVEIVTHHRNFRIPFAYDGATGDPSRELALFVSTNEGKTWEVASKVPPEHRTFTFRAPRDGVYWFAVRDTRHGEEADTKLSAVMKVKVDTGDRAEEKSPEPGHNDQLEEARLDVELLELELSTEKTQLRQYSQMLTQYEFGFGGMGGGMGGMGGGMGGGFGGGAPGSEQRKKGLASMRERYEELKSATLETARKVAQARRRLAALGGRTDHSTTSDRPLPSDRSSLAEQRAGLSLLELAFEVDRAVLREAMTELGKLELARTVYPEKSPGAQASANELHRLRDYIEEKKLALVKRAVELNIKKQELAETEERLKDPN